MKLNHLLLFTILIISFNAESQVIKGSLEFQNDRAIFDYTFVGMGTKWTECDSLGNFIIADSTINFITDTLVVRPFPAYVKVKIYNIPQGADTIELSPIPLFEELESGIPIINFKTKRASRKYFKKLADERNKQAQEFKKEIDTYIYRWNNKEYRLKVVEKDGVHTILIDLGS